MAELTIQIQGINELRRAFRDYPKIAEPIYQRAIEGTAAIFAKHTRKNDPVPYRTGNLLLSFRHKTGRLWARWFPTARYAPFVEFGTRPHLITPVKARALAWEQGGGAGYITSRTGRSYYKRTVGTMVFAMSVNHPGTRAKPFMGQIVRNATPDVNKLFGQALDLVNREVAKRTNQR